MSLLDECLEAIAPLDGKFLTQAAEKMDGRLKPPGSLGRLEELGIKMAAAQRSLTPDASKKVSLVYAGDHGVTAEGLSTAPREVTAVMTQAFCSGQAGINVLASLAGSIVKVVDVGIATDFPPPEGLIVRKVRKGTGNLRIEAAMSEAEALQAIEVGITTCRDAMKDTDAAMVGIGEMGIGNTTPAAALSAVFTELDPLNAAGPGTGLTADGVRKKARVIKDALELHKPDPTNPIHALAAVGGLEIAAMAGAMLAAAAGQTLILVDGYISSAAALVAAALNPTVTEWMVLSHLSAEPGHRAVATKLGLRPLLDLGLRLGEGTGAAMAMPLVEAGAALLSGMGSLTGAQIDLEDPSA